MPAPPERTPRRVLIVTREYPPAIGPHSIRVAKLAKYLPELGWQPSVVTTPVDHSWAVDETLAAEVSFVDAERVPRLFARRLHPRAGLATMTGPELPGPDEWQRGWRGRAVRWLLPDSSILWAIPAARSAARRADSTDVVLTTGPPFSTHLVGAWVHRRRGVPWVAEYRDNWTVNPLYRRAWPIQGLLRRLERWLLRDCAGVVVVSDVARREMLATFGFLGDRVQVAQNGFDPDDLPAPASRQTTFEIAYAGSLHRRRDPSVLLEVLGRLARGRDDLRRDLRLRLMGNSPRWVGDAATEAIGPSSVAIDGILPHREALERAGRAAVLLAISSRAEAGSAAMTSKFLEYLGLHRPILLLAPDGPARTLLAELGIGAAADPDDAGAIESAILRLYGDWASGHERLTEPGRLTSYTRRATAERVAGVLGAAVDQARRTSSASRRAASARPADADQR